MTKTKKGKLTELTMRFLLRHGPEQPDIVLNVSNKLRVTQPSGVAGLGGRARK